MKSKTDPVLQCLVCHGTLAAQIPVLPFCVIFIPPPSRLFFQCMLLFCPMRRPTAASGIPAQWGPYNWESCLLFSPLPPHFLTFFIFSPLICSLSLSEHMDRFSRERPVHIKAWGWAGQFVAALHSSSPSSSLSGLFLHRSHFPRMLHWPSSAA